MSYNTKVDDDMNKTYTKHIQYPQDNIQYPYIINSVENFKPPDEEFIPDNLYYDYKNKQIVRSPLPGEETNEGKNFSQTPEKDFNTLYVLDIIFGTAISFAFKDFIYDANKHLAHLLGFKNISTILMSFLNLISNIVIYIIVFYIVRYIRLHFLWVSKTR